MALLTGETKYKVLYNTFLTNAKNYSEFINTKLPTRKNYPKIEKFLTNY